ncbi:hypothetical protein HHK36_006868 [Tetracentron sinense]|uniref:Uncharacterized protein n=1 Tax=Tetracentron sinense TaxID=13715 RepID=A0A835DKR3_TETSI|nr:hypothetical protein HHK36_006868 [Tetracentron sinense]
MERGEQKPNLRALIIQEYEKNDFKFGGQRSVEKDIPRLEILEEVKKQLWLAGPSISVRLLQYCLQMISVMFVGHIRELALSGASMATSFASVTGFSLLMISVMFVGHLRELALSSASMATSFTSVTGFSLLMISIMLVSYLGELALSGALMATSFASVIGFSLLNVKLSNILYYIVLEWAISYLRHLGELALSGALMATSFVSVTGFSLLIFQFIEFSVLFVLCIATSIWELDYNDFVIFIRM